MAVDATLKLVLLGVDRSASKALKGVGKEAANTESKLGKLGKLGKGAALGLAAGLAGAGLMALDFGKDSLAAFAGAEKAQKQLEDAYARFPKVASVNIEALQEYNNALQRKTGADADDVASGQAVLAQFDLTGKQLKDMTPLLVDYATKTGKDIPSAAKTLGKAMLGNGRALKDLGVDFKDTGDPAKNYAQIMEGLKEKVGGYADSIPDAEKKQKILTHSFGDLQEEVGERLQPVMLGLVDAGQGVLDWLDANPQAVEGAAAAFGILGDVLTGIWEITRKYVAPALAWLIDGAAGVVRGFAGMLRSLGKVPGFEWATEAADKLDTTATGVDAVADGLRSLANDPPPKVDIDDTRAKAKAKQIETTVARLSKKAIKLRSEGDIKGAQKIEDKIKSLQRMKKDIKIGVGLTPVGKQKVTTIRGAGGAISTRFTASGHPSLPSGGLTWVGESGAELLQLPTGTRVFSNAQSRAMVSQGRTGGGGTSVVLATTVQGDTDPYGAARRIERKLLELVKSRGPGGTLSFLRKR